MLTNVCFIKKETLSIGGKGQLISKCLIGAIVSTKKPTKKF